MNSTRSNREPSIATAFACLVAVPLFIGATIFLALTQSEGYMSSSLDTKAAAIIGLVTTTFTVAIIGFGTWSLFKRQWKYLLVAVGAFSLLAVLADLSLHGMLLAVRLLTA